jgi:ankyrin repeat protein
VGDRDAAFDAIAAGDAERLRALLDDDPALAGARGEDGVSLILRARYAMRDDLVEAVLSKGPDLDVYDAAALGDVDRLRELCEEDPQRIRALSGDGFSPLHLAAFFGGGEGVRALLALGAEVNAEAANATRVTPLHSAAARCDADAVGRLLEAGADPNAQQRGGFTALHAAASAGDAAMAEVLMESGGDPSIQTDEGQTAADVAQERGHGDVADLMREQQE